MSDLTRIAHLSGPTATIQNTPPLLTSNKARRRHGLPLLTGADGVASRFDALRPQRLAAPVTVYVEQFSAHPLEADTPEIYGEPDGWVDADGAFSTTASEGATPVYAIELEPEDGLYPLPYMGVQASGEAWDGLEDRQGFFPDGSRSFEEIDRLGVDHHGRASMISSQAVVDFYRVAPPGGWTKGLPAARRTDVGEGDIAPETRGEHFNAYAPPHLGSVPARPALARITNEAQRIADSGMYDGLVWTQGSPQVEETAYWFNLLLDTTLPVCANAAQRPQGMISADGPKNIVDSVALVRSGVWRDEGGRNRCGVVVVEEQQYFAAREVYKSDARPGNYRATGGHGGILGQTTHTDAVKLMYVPAYRHTHTSQVNLTRLPTTTTAVRRGSSGLETVEVRVKIDGLLQQDAIPSVSIVKEGGYHDEQLGLGADDQVPLLAMVEHKLGLGRLAGFVTEGLVPYGRLPSKASEALLQRAVFSGLPVVRVGRGAPEGFADPTPLTIAGSNLTSIKARLLLMAALMKLGSLPVAVDPSAPTEAERAATAAAVERYQEVFDTH